MFIHHEFSNRSDGDMRKDENVSRFLIKNFVEGPFVLAEQSHGAKITTVDKHSYTKVVPMVDGLVSSEQFVLGIRTADCVPVLFYDAISNIIGAAHSGWKGTYNNIVKNVICEMLRLGGKIENINVILGPHIQVCCYDVDVNRKDLFVERYGPGVIREEYPKFFLNLQKVIHLQLRDCNVQCNTIDPSNCCTSCNNDEYFSYRKDSSSTYGQQIAIIGFNGYN